MRITVSVEKVDTLLLKEEMGTGKIGGESLSFGVCLPAGTPYVYVRGAYYSAPDIFEVMLRAVHEQEGCEEHPASCDEHVAELPGREHVAQPASPLPRSRKPEGNCMWCARRTTRAMMNYNGVLHFICVSCADDGHCF